MGFMGLFFVQPLCLRALVAKIIFFATKIYEESKKSFKNAAKEEFLF